MTLKMSTVTISIHALVKRATLDDDYFNIAKQNFNPRPREEGDLSPTSNIQPAVDFNPRPREEGDL